MSSRSGEFARIQLWKDPPTAAKRMRPGTELHPEFSVDSEVLDIGDKQRDNRSRCSSCGAERADDVTKEHGIGALNRVVGGTDCWLYSTHCRLVSRRHSQ